MRSNSQKGPQESRAWRFGIWQGQYAPVGAGPPQPDLVGNSILLRFFKKPFCGYRLHSRPGDQTTSKEKNENYDDNVYNFYEYYHNNYYTTAPNTTYTTTTMITTTGATYYYNCDFNTITTTTITTR